MGSSASVVEVTTSSSGAAIVAVREEDSTASAIAQIPAARVADGSISARCNHREEQQQQQPQPRHQQGFVRSLVVAGGVAANAAVRAGLSAVAAEFGLACVVPPVRWGLYKGRRQQTPFR